MLGQSGPMLDRRELMGGLCRTLFFDSKSYKPDPVLATPREGEAFLGDWEKSLLTVGKFDTVSVIPHSQGDMAEPLSGSRGLRGI